ERGLRIEIHQQHALALLRGDAGQRGGDGGLAHPALLVGDRQHLHGALTSSPIAPASPMTCRDCSCSTTRRSASSPSAITTSTTRRLRLRPSGVALLATGRCSPRPSTAMRCGSMPRSWKRCTTLAARAADSSQLRSEEHTSELQSREKIVCRLLLEKKKDSEMPC